MSLEISRLMWLKLYKDLISQGKQFSSYNFREYAVRRIRDHFRLNKGKNLSKDELKQLYDKGAATLESLKRQVAVSKIYAGPKLILEKELLCQKI